MHLYFVAKCGIYWSLALGCILQLSNCWFLVEGGSLAFQVLGHDAFGNPCSLGPEEVTLQGSPAEALASWECVPHAGANDAASVHVNAVMGGIGVVHVLVSGIEAHSESVPLSGNAAPLCQLRMVDGCKLDSVAGQQISFHVEMLDQFGNGLRQVQP